MGERTYHFAPGTDLASELSDALNRESTISEAAVNMTGATVECLKEITRLRAELDETEHQRDEAVNGCREWEGIVAKLRAERDELHSYKIGGALEIARLRAEREELVAMLALIRKGIRVKAIKDASLLMPCEPGAASQDIKPLSGMIDALLAKLEGGK